jgi:hypothetical protein
MPRKLLSQRLHGNHKTHVRAASATLSGSEACDIFAGGATWAATWAERSHAFDTMCLGDCLGARNFSGDRFGEHATFGAFCGNSNFLGNLVESASADNFSGFVGIFGASEKAAARRKRESSKSCTSGKDKVFHARL